MNQTIKEVKENLKKSFFPKFAQYMQQVRESLDLMQEELSETIEKLDDIRDKIEEIENLKDEVN